MRRRRKEVRRGRDVVRLDNLLELVSPMELEMHPRKPVFPYELARESGLLNESAKPVRKQAVEFGVAYGCNQCGSCCKLEWDIDVGADDLSRWITLQLGAILLYVCFNPKWMAGLSYTRKLSPPLMMIDNGYDSLFWGWPTRPACRFLIHKHGTLYCGIHRVKPSICRLYPFFWKEDGLLRVRGSQFGACCGVTDYFRNLSRETGTRPEVLAGNAEKVETDAGQQQSEDMKSQTGESEDALKSFMKYARENSSLRRKADLLLRAGRGTYRIPIGSSRGLAILTGYLQSDPLRVMRQLSLHF